MCLELYGQLLRPRRKHVKTRKREFLELDYPLDKHEKIEQVKKVYRS